VKSQKQIWKLDACSFRLKARIRLYKTSTSTKQSNVARLLSYGGKILRAVRNKTGKTIRVLEYGVDDRKFLEDLFAPSSILTINTIWLPDGTTETRVILKKRGRRIPPFHIEALKQIAREARGMTLRVEFSY
jgi:transcription antitermination factor NusA-like protein